MGVVGLGNMGGLLAARLARSGPVVASDPDPERHGPRARHGVEVLDGPAAVAAAAGVLILSLPRPDVSRAVLEEALPELRGGLVIEAGTVSPADARAMHERAARPAPASSTRRSSAASSRWPRARARSSSAATTRTSSAPSRSCGASASG